MKTDNGRILVIGAGVNGCACATELYKAGIDVTILARGKRYDDIKTEGIIIENPFNNKRSIIKVPVINELQPEDIYDYILVIIRKNQISPLLPVLANNKTPNVVFMGNSLSSPAEYISAISKDRVLMGSVFAGGRREDNIIKAIIIKSIAGAVGEIDGTITPRLIRLKNILRQGGFKTKTSTHIVDALVTHAAGIPAFALLVMKYNLNMRELTKSTKDLFLMVDAIRESYSVIKTLGYKIIPKSTNLVYYIPRFIQVALLRILLNTKFIEVGGVYHVSQAPDEMNFLAGELKDLVEKSGLPVPAVRKVLKMN
jgi:2-dehydropantoate 2-reductase